MRIQVLANVVILLCTGAVRHVFASPVTNPTATAPEYPSLLYPRKVAHGDRRSGRPHVARRQEGSSTLDRSYCRQRTTRTVSVTTTSTSFPNDAPASTPSSGVILAPTDNPCGNSNATPDPSPTGGPNGDQKWLNCNMDTSGWVPPPIMLDNLIRKELSQVLQTPNSPFSRCQEYLGIFESTAQDTGIPSIVLASIALQESGCKRDAMGGGGEVGLMQITPDKCNGVPDCYDPATNIGIGARYFKGVLSDNSGNVAATLGQYNGWGVGMKTVDATNWASCTSSKNLDYLQRVLNGYLQGIEPDSLNMHMYNNVQNCMEKSIQ